MMNKAPLSSILFCFAAYAFALDGTDSNTHMLPSPFPVYVIENAGVINHPAPGAVQVFLPTDNSYAEAPGCYIACYSHKSGVYSVGPDISVMGQIRVKGTYEKRICQPDGFQHLDISKSDQLKGLCAEKIEACRGANCWAGGDTGGWFGIQ
ncbi:MAG: hypothetical protein P4L65_08535 [Legionella sp.]|nr:hypothetical protein [Legionella sp.]